MKNYATHSSRVFFFVCVADFEDISCGCSILHYNNTMEKMALRKRNQPFSVCVQLTVRVCEALVARSFCSRGEEGELLFVCFYIPECFCSRQRERFWILKSTIILAYELIPQNPSSSSSSSSSSSF